MTDLLATARCGQCAALLRPNQLWCTLCHADLRPAPAPTPEDLYAVDPRPDAVRADEASADVLTDPRPGVTPPLDGPAGTGKHARRATPTSDGVGAAAGTGTHHPGLRDSDIDAMLVQLAAQTQAPLGALSGRFETRGAKVGLTVGLGFGAMLVLLLGAVVLTTLFG